MSQRPILYKSVLLWKMKSTISLAFTWLSIPLSEHFPCEELIFNNNLNCKYLVNVDFNNENKKLQQETLLRCNIQKYEIKFSFLSIVSKRKQPIILVSLKPNHGKLWLDTGYAYKEDFFIILYPIYIIIL
jgi:hypothetical protein